MYTIKSNANNFYGTGTYFKHALNTTNLSAFLGALLGGNITGYAVEGKYTDDGAGGFNVLNPFLQNTSDYLVKLSYYPVDISKFVDPYYFSQHNSVFIGKAVYQLPNDGTCHLLYYANSTLKIGTYTATREHNNFLDFEPYTTFTLSIPFFDRINVPCKYMYAGINIYMSIDFNSGQATIYITDKGSTNDVPLVTQSTQLAIDLPLGSSNQEQQNRNNILQTISLIGSGLGLVAGVASGNPLITAGSIGLGAKAITTYLQNNVDTYSGQSGSGGRNAIACDRGMYVFKETVSNVQEAPAHIVGRPCNQTGLLSSFTGFTQVGEIHFNPMNNEIYQDEIEEIVSLLQTGVIL